MRKIDDFLIDRAFQPAADWLEPRISCYGIAAFLATGSTVAYIASFTDGATWVVMLLAAMNLPNIIRFHRLDEKAITDVAPAIRVVNAFWRLVAVSFVAFDVTCWVTRTWPLNVYLSDSGWMLYTAASYFSACRRHPPRRERKTARVPASLVSARAGAE